MSYTSKGASHVFLCWYQKRLVAIVETSLLNPPKNDSFFETNWIFSQFSSRKTNPDSNTPDCRGQKLCAIVEGSFRKMFLKFC